MNKKILILSLMSLILVVCCQSNDDFYTYEKVICNNQSVWDNRVGYDDFNCKMLKRNYPAIRDCVATNYYIKNDKVVINNYPIVCSEERVACRKGFGCIPYWQYQAQLKN